jgi:hypothetical protein
MDKKLNGSVWIGFIWFRKGTTSESCERDNETSSSIKGGEFLDYLSDY